MVEDAYQDVLITEDVADLLEEIEVENPAVNIEETRNTNVENELLYENSRITVGESLLLIMAFIMRHKLSLVASEDLIGRVELHCPGQNNALKGLSRFREFVQCLKHPMKKHFSCPNPKCRVYISASKPQDGDVCRICKEPLSEKSLFLELPVEEQLKTVLSCKSHAIFTLTQFYALNTVLTTFSKEKCLHNCYFFKSCSFVLWSSVLKYNILRNYDCKDGFSVPSAIYLLMAKSHSSHLKLALTEQFN